MVKKEKLTKEEKVAILNENLDIIYKFCHNNKKRYIGDYENFSDFISNCTVLAYDNIDKWDFNRSALSTYIYNTLPWQLQNQKTRDKSVRTDSLDEILDANPDTVLYDEAQMQNEDRKFDEKVLKVIKPYLHKYTKMYYLDGKSYKEIAESEGKSLTTIKNAVYKNLAELREVIKNEVE